MKYLRFCAHPPDECMLIKRIEGKARMEHFYSDSYEKARPLINSPHKAEAFFALVSKGTSTAAPSKCCSLFCGKFNIHAFKRFCEKKTTEAERKATNLKHSFSEKSISHGILIMSEAISGFTAKRNKSTTVENGKKFMAMFVHPRQHIAWESRGT